MDFRILGRLEVLDDGVDVAPRRTQPRALLGMLLLHPNELLTTDRLLEALWGEHPPATADKALQGHISTLRKVLGHERVITERGAYRLHVQPGELDADRFATAVAGARGEKDERARARALADALATWRGEPLADLASERFAQAEIARLVGLRLAALEAWAEAELALGRHAEVLPELERQVAQHPLSEGLRGRLMVALYRAGRQADALRVYRDARRYLAEELGMDPGAELQLLERQILAHDPALQAPIQATSAPGPARQERKTVTVLVVEVVPVGANDPEDMERDAQPVLAHVRSIVERAGGRAEPLFANALLGIFGAPKAHDDDALRAVRTALDLLEADASARLRLRGGIDTGEALVTIDGADVAITGQVLGTASRLQLAADPGSILVGDATHRATEAAIDYRPVSAGIWVPEGRRTSPRAALPEGPFIGRADELELLERILDRATAERSVQLVTVMAEPGGGKSRLVRELRAKLESSASPAIWRQGSCLPYGESVTYWALGEVVKAQAELLESDDSETSAAKVAAVVRDLESDDTRRTWLERSLRALVGIEHTPASGDREQAFAAWRHFLEAVAAQAPLVVVFEDIHWADEAFLGFLDHVVSQASGVPLMVVCTARLEHLEAHPGWAGGKRNATTIALEPLSVGETGELLHALLGRAPEPTTIRRAGGNPLFAHELARIVSASPQGEPASVPESLQAVIAANLDALAPELKAVASDAAVVGEVFWSGAVAEMGAIEEAEAERRLQRLVAHDVARRRRPSTVARQSEYAFLHVLVRDVAYRQIPRRDRIGKHRGAAEWIERLAGDRVTNYAELIAHHYVQALEIATGLGDEAGAAAFRAPARQFLTLAGEGARTVETTQAESFYLGALALTDEDDAERGRLLSRLGEVAQLTGRLAESERLCREAIVALRAHDDLKGEAEAMVTLTATLWRLGRPEAQRRGLIADAIRALEQLPAGPELVLAYSRMATHELHAGRAGACGDWSRKALALADQLGLVAQKVSPLHHLGIARFETGDPAGIDDIREALRIGLEAGLSSETAIAHSNLAATVWVTEGPLAALELKRGAAEFASSRGLSTLATQVRAESLWQLYDAGLWDAGLDVADALLALDPERGSSRVRMMAQTVKARILVERGRTDEASELEGEFLARAREFRDPQDLGPALAAAAARRTALGQETAAAELIAELERVTRGRDPSQRVHELPQAARVCLASGTLDVARALIPTRRAPNYVRARLCLASAEAILAEGRGEAAAAADLHAAAADGWGAFGSPAEEAHARIGHGRCLIAIGRSKEARQSLEAARRIGRQLGAVGVLREAEGVLASGSAAGTGG